MGDGDVIQCRFDPHQGLWQGLTVTANRKRLDPVPFAGGPVPHLDDKELSVEAGGVKAGLLDASLEVPLGDWLAVGCQGIRWQDA